LFTGLAFEADMGRDDKIDFAIKPGRQGAPTVHIEDHAEMANRHVFPIYRGRGGGRTLIRRKMRDDLVAVEIEIYPRVTAAPFRAFEQAAIEGARGG
jgi:hypothetical protein